MGLRDRLRLLVRPPPAPAPARAGVVAPPAPASAAPRVILPRAVPSAPVGARVIHVGPGPAPEGAETLAPAGWPALRGAVCFVSKDGGRAASAAAERAASFGSAEVSWVAEGRA